MRVDLINLATLLMAVAVAGICFAGLMSIESATAENVKAVYVSLHGGGQ